MVKKLTAKQKRAKKKRLKKKIIERLREKVVARDKSTCQHCDKLVSGRNLHLSHVKSKGAYGHLQFDPLNTKVLCFRCHIHWWHKEPSEAWDWFKEKFPERVDYLEKHLEPVPNFNSISHLEKILDEL